MNQVVTFFCSCGSQWPEVADIWHVPSICWNHHDWAPPEWQEEEVHNQVKEQQLGSKIQWNVSFVSLKNILRIWHGKCRCRGTDRVVQCPQGVCTGPRRVHQRVAWSCLWCLGRKAGLWKFLLWVGQRGLFYTSSVLWPPAEMLSVCPINTFYSALSF